MKNFTLSLLFTTVFYTAFSQNPLAIPPVLSGDSITLVLQEGTTIFYSPFVTNTMGANGPLLGPTLILEKDSLVSIFVDNQLQDTTTIHWHGMHVAPENDGGPHITIPPGTVWNPEFTVMDKAGIHWYHPHMHMKTDEHVSKGIAGLIIVKDPEEAALTLPGTYGVDDFPIVIQTKGFDAAGQIEIHTEGDTSVMVNGTIDATVDFPAQVVRMRVLNGSSQRVMEVGFSDNRSFSLIGTDGGLLTAPVSLTRYRMAPGQRADILVNLTADFGNSIQLMSYGSELPNAVYGAAQPGMGPGATIPGYTLNPLNGSDFQLLDINVVAPTASPVLTIPGTLANFTPIPEASANITRNLTFTSAGAMGNLEGPFLINGSAFDMMVINYEVPLDNVEIWSLTNQTPIAHPFHIHDVQFFILDINGNPPPPQLAGYNDVVLVPAGNGNVRFIALFNDFASDTYPYMYHCHMLTHEDGGMMGQFLVRDPNSGLYESLNEHGISLYPNPSVDGEIHLDLSAFDYEIYGIEVRTLTGDLVKEVETVADNLTLNLLGGAYFLQLRTSEGVITKKFIVAM